MTDSHPPEVQAPFDALPPAPSESTVPAAASAGQRARGKTGLLLAALAVVAAGVGQAIGLSLLFDDRPERLSPTHAENPIAQGEPAAAARKPEPQHAEEPAPAPSQAPPPAALHVLEVGRQRLAQGDVEGARRIAAQYLLRLDGLSHADAERAPEACVLLGDVLRSDFELALDRRRGAEAAEAAPAKAAGEDRR